MHEYLKQCQEPLMQCVLKHECEKKLYSVVKESNKFSEELEIEAIINSISPEEQNPIKKIKGEAKKAALKQHLESWQKKPLHGQFPTRAEKADVDKELTHKWLRSGGLKGETEGFLVAAQDQSLATNAQKCHIFGTINDPKCRLCRQYDETIDHLVSGCPMLAANEYTFRHDKVGRYIHWKICQHFQLPTTEKWYDHQPQPVTEKENITVLWDFSISTDKTIKANRPDIVIKNNNTKKCLLIDMTIPSDRNIGLKEFEKLSKYKDLEMELHKSWQMDVETVPVVIGALGTIRIGTKNLISKIPGTISVEQIQKIALLGTAHILRKSLSMK